MAEKQTDPGFENAGPEGTNGAAGGKLGRVKDDALTARTDDFSLENGEIPLEPDYELFDADFEDREWEERDNTDELALLSGDLEGYLLDEFDWPVERQRPFRAGVATNEEGNESIAQYRPDPLVTALVAQAVSARRAPQAAVLMGATVPLLARHHAADDALLRPILPTLVILVANAARRLHRHAHTRQTLTRLPQLVDRTIALLRRYVSTKPRLTPALTAHVLSQQLAGQLPAVARRPQRGHEQRRGHERRGHRRRFYPPDRRQHRRDGRFYPESSDDPWLDMDVWHGEDSF